MVKLRPNKKIIILRDFSKLKKTLGKEKKVLVGGCFDVFHFGHWVFLTQAKKQGDFLIIALEPDRTIRLKKKREPVHNQDERAKILASFDFVDLVIKLPYFKKNKEYFDLVKLTSPSVIAITKGDLQLKNKQKQAKMVGGRVKGVTDKIKSLASSKIFRNASFSGS